LFLILRFVRLAETRGTRAIIRAGTAAKAVFICLDSRNRHAVALDHL